MTRKPRNTQRGSVVQWRKQKRKAALRTLFESKEQRPALPLATLARDLGLGVRQVQARWHRWQEAGADEAARDAACSSLRGGHNRVFTAEQERLLASVVKAATPAMAHPQIVNAALQLKCAADTHVHRTRCHTRQLHHRPFVASSRFVNRFKRAHRLSSHRTAVKFKPKPKEGEDKDATCLEFVTEVHSALLQYSPSLVLNMDETPIKLIDAPVTGVVATGSKEAATMETSAGAMGTKITCLPCISAAGDKLPLSVVIRGKTPRCLKKITEGASAAVKKVELFYSEKGWVNEEIMVHFFRSIILPYTHSRPAALLLDSYSAHFTPAVQEAAAAMNLQLIEVPAGMTSSLQPLDVSFNGPMLKVRQKIWRKEKEKDAWEEETQQGAVERAQRAYESISREATIAAWRKAQLLHV